MTARNKIAGWLLLTVAFACSAESDRDGQFSGCGTQSGGMVLLDSVAASAVKAICVELAATPEETARGLMFRERLPENHGLLFILDPPQAPSLWMKNMRFSLDVILISDKGRVAAARAALPPCRETPCPVYRFSEAVKYVLEVPSGLLVRHPVQAGDRAEIRLDRR